MLRLSCHCGQVRLELATRPDYIHACNCSLCAKSGARWSYLHPCDVTVAGPTNRYSRSDKADPAAEIRFCARCGSTTHFVLTAAAAAKFGNGVAGVNMRLADEDDLAGLELRYPDGRAWSGEGAFGYVREARILGAGAGLD
ncbi:GFA family protein [Sphingomonas sp.]|uniref:GFA family protein n=1 Tax=Sphingomonas sp. TaxID=28214 RepID=UPI003B005022